MTQKKLLFVDTNILLDFYRGRNEVTLGLLKHVEAVSSQLIMTYQLEIEFKKNRQSVIIDGLGELKSSQVPPRLGIFSDAHATKAIAENIVQANQRMKKLKIRLTAALSNPATNDPIYKICQRLFRNQNQLVLRRDEKLRHMVRRKAFRRFLHGCPPRKKNDTSIGDAFNWEWMIHCCQTTKSDLHLVSRDSDFGVTLGESCYVNDHLKQEFSDRVSKRKKVFLYAKLSEALKNFEVKVSKQEEEAEKQILSEKEVDKAVDLNYIYEAQQRYIPLSNLIMPKMHNEDIKWLQFLEQNHLDVSRMAKLKISNTLIKENPVHQKDEDDH